MVLFPYLLDSSQRRESQASPSLLPSPLDSKVALAADRRQSGALRCRSLGRFPLLFVLGIGALLAGSALAQQPVRPLPKVGGCPLGYYSSGSYCVPSSSGNTSGALEKSGNSCPLGFYSSGNYCLSSPSNDREAIQKIGNSCPLGWFSFGNYCVKSR